MSFESKDAMFRRVDAAMERSLAHREATIRRGEAIRDALMMAPLQHFFVDTVTNHAGFWVARCNCGYTTLGYATPENAQMNLDRFHTGRAR